jgi:hypothetical protein
MGGIEAMNVTTSGQDEPRCVGCGVRLQTADPNLPGYVPEQALEREQTVCRRCFRIKHYNEALSAAVPADAFRHILEQIAYWDGLILHIADIFDFEGSLIGGLHRYVGQKPVLLAVNKVDLLPKAINPNRIVHWIKRQAKANGLRVRDAVLISARKNIGFDRLMDAIAAHRGDRDVYVVGAANVGKSTLVNRLIRDYSDLDVELTTSRYPGTTLDLIRIPLDDGRALIDTPGVLYPYRLTEIVPKRELQALIPDKPLKPVVYQLNPAQTVFMGAYARFDFLEGEPQSFTFYVANAIHLHRTKLEKAAELYEAHKGEMLAPPSRETLAELPPWTRYEFRTDGSRKQDVFISGLGWIAINGDTGAKVAVHVPRGIRVGLRDSLL